jgi:hypothetical protein
MSGHRARIIAIIILTCCAALACASSDDVGALDGAAVNTSPAGEVEVQADGQGADVASDLTDGGAEVTTPQPDADIEPEICVPDCAGKDCGTDGCGGSCGDCCEGDDCVDQDGDGFDALEQGGTDCDDHRASVHPGAPEGCDGLDNDCDADIDEGCPPCRDAACDGALCATDCEAPACALDCCDGACGLCEDGAVCITGACCQPDCVGRECGSDGCGGACGACPEWSQCDDDGLCQVYNECGVHDGQAGCGGCACQACVAETDPFCAQHPWDDRCVSLCKNECGGCGPCAPDCAGKTCGPDGCGGVCGVCGAGQACEAGQCVSGCQGDCAGRECGSDGCGFSCGDCPDIDEPNMMATILQVCDGGHCRCGRCDYSWSDELMDCDMNGCHMMICWPDCTGRECGPDGCGGICGMCGWGATCDMGQCACALPERLCAGPGGEGCDMPTLEVTALAWGQAELRVKGADGVGIFSFDPRDDLALELPGIGCSLSYDNMDGLFRVSCGGCEAVVYTADFCEGCVPDCEGKSCGDDGCGSACGACPAGCSCVSGACQGCAYCGDGSCDMGEDPIACPQDCLTEGCEEVVGQAYEELMAMGAGCAAPQSCQRYDYPICGSIGCFQGVVRADADLSTLDALATEAAAQGCEPFHCGCDFLPGAPVCLQQSCRLCPPDCGDDCGELAVAIEAFAATYAAGCQSDTDCAVTAVPVCELGPQIHCHGLAHRAGADSFPIMNLILGYISLEPACDWMACDCQADTATCADGVCVPSMD